MANITPLYKDVNVKGLDQVVDDIIDNRKKGLTLIEIAKIFSVPVYTLACIEYSVLKTIHEFLDKGITDPAEPATRLGLRISTVDKFSRFYELCENDEEKDLHSTFLYE